MHPPVPIAETHARGAASIAAWFSRRGLWRWAALTLLLMSMVTVHELAFAQPAPQQKRARPAPSVQPKAVPDAAAPAAPAPDQKATVPDLKETVQADVSTRSVAITSSFTGTEIVVFGAVDNSRQSSAESGLYDIVIVLEGTPTPLVSRRKSNVFGIWINTQSVTFEAVPSYYAIASTRPLDELADPLLLRESDIGFEQVRMNPIRGWETGLSTADIADFKSAVIRLKQKEGLYVQDQYGVVFIGRSLFRASIELPPNVPVGPLVARVYLLREGQLLSKYTARVKLERQGLERLLHSFAFEHSFLYGLFTVSVAVGAALLASAVFRRSS
jgi:uncharacterized protein (TIGR02186 family)